MKATKRSKHQLQIEVRDSSVHGKGVFALEPIEAGAHIIEYAGKRITQDQADEMWPVDPDNPFHTFFFSLSSGKVIDGGDGGNESRWINHSCDPNCEAVETPQGRRVNIVALRDIEVGEELFFDYSLVIDEEMTDELKQDYACCCGSPKCRGTMLLLNNEEDQEETV